MTKVYLACPYTDNGENAKAVMEFRFKESCRVAGDLMNQGYLVFSPIASTHSIALVCQLPRDIEFWKKHDETFLEWADEIFVMDLPGWNTSVGVQWEIQWAIDHGKEWRVIHV